jgi:hypothetical protein
MTDPVKKALEQLDSSYPGEKRIEVQEDGAGGVYVIVNDVDIGTMYEQSTTWVGFRIVFNYPYADVYPHFVRPDLVRNDGRPLGDGISGGHRFLGRTALQLSRRSNRLNPATDTAATKLLKVVQWLVTHP